MKKKEKASPESDSMTRIIDAATEVFADAGYAGARVDEIARRAKINKAALYYHIGGKAALYSEVLRRLLGDSPKLAKERIRQASSPEEQLRIYIRSLVELVWKNSYLAPIMLREIASGGKHVSGFLLHTLFGLLETLTEILQEGEQQGVFIHVVPISIHFMIVGTALFLKARKSLLTESFQLPEPLAQMEQELSGRVVEELEKLILRAVKK